MKISEALSRAKNIFSQSFAADKFSNPGLDALILMIQATSFSKEKIIFNPDFELDSVQEKNFFALIERRKKREPISHLIGKREFYGREFLVNSNVLDPRPDSENLIEMALENFLPEQKKIKILELGVGSGCLVITLLASNQLAEGVGIDISDKALEICHKNSVTHQVQNRLQLVKSDLFSALNQDEKFDLIISNPPYIPSAEIEKLQDEVRIYEPRSALDGGEDGLDFYRKIAAQAKSFLQKNGRVILEIGCDQKEKVVEIFLAADFLFTGSKHDLSGFERVLCFK